MIVIDASALVAYLLREEGFEEIAGYIRSHRVVSVDMVAKEAANAIVTALRRGRIGEEHAEKAFEALNLLVNSAIELHHELDLLNEAFSIAKSTGVTIYDALYIALAKRLGATLITRDRRQHEAAKNP